MKKFKIFFSIVLLMILTLSSCNKKEETTESINVNQVSTGVENISDDENKEALEEVNSEVDKFIDDIEDEVEKNGEENIKTGSVNTGTIDTSASTGEYKVKKLSKTYMSPGGNDEVAFSIKMDGDKIASVTVEKIKGDETSEKLIKSFGNSINTVIVGKTIEEAQNISVVGGASLTTNAFKEAIKNM